MSNKSEETKRFLVELDCLLDTRLGTLEHYSPPIAYTVYQNPDYFKRDWDNWEGLSKGGITNNKFWELYAQRDVEVLSKSRPTSILGFLGKITKELDMARITSPEVEHIQVDVNVFPYELSETEKDQLRTLVFHYCALGTEVNVVSLSLKSITPQLLKERYDGLILYEFDNWFTHHVNTLNHVLIPRHAVFAPALYIKDPAELLEETPEEFLDISPFAQFEMALIERISLELLNAKEFSVSIPPEDTA